MLLLHYGREMLGDKTSGSALKGSPPEPTSNKVWLFQNRGKFQKDLADDQSILEETLILPVFFFLSKKKHFLSTNVTASSLKFVIDKLTDTEVNVVEKDQAVRAVLSNVKVSTFTGLLTTVFHLPFLVQVKLLPGHLNLYLFHEIFKKNPKARFDN